MHRVNRSALVPYTPAQMYGLVADVPAYPEFLPWCKGAVVLSSTDAEAVAKLKVGFEKINISFTTVNTMHEPDAIHLRLSDGPFRALDGRWAFRAIGESGCEVELRMDFEFSNKLQEKIMGASFERICGTLVDAFIERAHAKFG
jgi:ribosome-associated toxin RatA of RatAB toxin-antitoxin module